MEDNCFTIFCWFLLYINMNQPEAYICPLPLKPPSHLLPHSTSLGCHRALGCTANSHQLSISHVMYMFQCYCLYSSYPLLPPLCPQVHFLCPHLHYCHENRIISKGFIHIYIYIYTHTYISARQYHFKVLLPNTQF